MPPSFFPLYASFPPTQLPPLPSPPNLFPKYPSSSSSSSNSLPFFPLYPSPPPPRPSPSIPTFPANISTLITPSHYTPRPSTKLILIISLPILSLIFLSLFTVLLFIRRYRSSNNDLEDPGSDNHRLVPPNSTSSDKLTATSANATSASEFLYLGTLVNSRGHVDVAGEVKPANAVDSPELRPLPPLSRQAPRSFSSEEEAFYSPPPSPPLPPIQSNPPPPPPPPPPPVLRPPVLAPPKAAGRRPRLKALHWDKVRASSERTMVWDHLKSSSFQ